MCAYYKSQGKSLLQELENLYQRFGFYKTDLQSTVYEGEQGMGTMSAIIDKIRINPPKVIEGNEVAFTDFSLGVDGLPVSNVLRFKNKDVRLIIRPSGTEPKLKIYYQVKGETEQQAQVGLQKMKDWLNEFLLC